MSDSWEELDDGAPTVGSAAVASSKKPAPKGRGNNKDSKKKQQEEEEEEEDEEEEDDDDDDDDDDDEDDEEEVTPTGSKKDDVDEAAELGGLTQILPYLFISDAASAGNKDALSKANITYILNASGDDVANQFEKDFKYAKLALHDAIDFPIEKHFGDAFEIILYAKSKNKNILVFDEDATAISPTLVIAYMMKASIEKKKKLQLSDAFKYVSGKLRGQMEINEGFMSQLLKLEKELTGEVTMGVAQKPKRNKDKDGGKGDKKDGGKDRGGRGGSRGGRGGRGGKDKINKPKRGGGARSAGNFGGGGDD